MIFEQCRAKSVGVIHRQQHIAVLWHTKHQTASDWSSQLLTGAIHNTRCCQRWLSVNFSSQANANLVVGARDLEKRLNLTYLTISDNCKFEHPGATSQGNRSHNQQSQSQNSGNRYGALGGHNVTPANNTGFGGNSRNQPGPANNTGYRGANQGTQGYQGNQRNQSGSTSIWAPLIIYKNLTWHAGGPQSQNTRNPGSNR